MKQTQMVNGTKKRVKCVHFKKVRFLPKPICGTDPKPNPTTMFSRGIGRKQKLKSFGGVIRVIC